MFGPILANLVGGILPNIAKSAGTFVTGILDNISNNKPVDISGNLSKGIKTLVGDITQPGNSAPANYGKSESINSTGGSDLWEPQDILKKTKNAANLGLGRISRLNQSLYNKNNVTNGLTIIPGDNTRMAMKRGRVETLTPLSQPMPMTGNQPQLLPGESIIPYGDGGLTGRRMGTGYQRKKVKGGNAVALRNNNGYQGYKARKQIVLPSFNGEAL
jgi:hypothetical protein